MHVSVLTISDACSRGERADGSGDAIVAWLAERGYQLAERALVPDDAVEIVRMLTRWCDADADGGQEGAPDVVLTTGGTGLSPRDVTPEATRAVLERDAPGIAERLRVIAMDRVPNAALSRGLAGTRGRTLVVNLPGSPSAVRDNLAALAPILDHAVSIIRGTPGVHPPAPRPTPSSPR